jgi:CP12 domain
MTNVNDITLVERIEEARQEVATLCETKGATSPECAVAADTLEELLAAKSHKNQQPTKNALQQFCEDNPDADECRLYED